MAFITALGKRKNRKQFALTVQHWDAFFFLLCIPVTESRSSMNAVYHGNDRKTISYMVNLAKYADL